MKRTSRRFYLTLFLTILAAVFWLLIHSVQARLPLAVELVSFTAVGISNGVELQWETATEIGAAAFQLERGQGAAFVTLTQLVDETGQPYPGGLIEAEGSPTIGAIYIARDLTAVPGQSYTYRLIEIETNNNTTAVASATVIAGATATPTQIIIGATHTPLPTVQNTATSLATPPLTATSMTTTAAQTTATRVMATPTAIRTESESSTQATAGPPVTNNNNTSTTSSSENQPVMPTATESGIIEIAQTQPTPASGYPGQVTPSEAATESSYPEAVVTPLTISATETPYPDNTLLPEQQPTPTIIGVVGGQTNGTSGAADPGQVTPETTASSTGALWVGFLAGLLIFGAAVVGSIALFVRRRQ